MPTEIDKIFTATAKSTWHFLIENGQGCYIPAYQRPYAWDTENISRLFEDILHGIHQIRHRPDTISFFGTIIAIHDTKYDTVKPIYKPEVAPRVMTIIDGQQRICTAVMSNIVLHDYIRRTVAKFKGDEEKRELHLSWISEECTQLLAELKDTYMIDRHSGDGNYRYYPRVIRAFSDAWSRRRAQAQYKSPVARLIWEYINFTEDGEGKTAQFKFKPTETAGKLIDHYKMVHEAFRAIQRNVDRICRLKDDPNAFPDLITATQEKSFSEGIWGFSLPDKVKTYIAEESSDTDYDDFCYLLRLIIFARYLNHRLAITVVTAGNEDDAFDMFEALNTTGEPLTAFETFKPKVIDSETLKEYEHSSSFESIKQIEKYLDRFKKADDKQRATSEMLVPFALAETGWKLQKKLNSQRRYLRDEFDELTDIERKRDFVHSIAGIASFMRHGWNVERGEDPSFKPLVIEDEEALVGFEALRGLNHTITIAPLSRFYQRALDATQDTDRNQLTEEFVAAIKATVAFSFLWRGATGGTENIDSHYRDMMRFGIADQNIPPLARRPPEKSGVVSLTNYKKTLRWFLKSKVGVGKKDEWVKRVTGTDVYSHSNVLARFLLFCASDDAVPDAIEKGLIERGRPKLAPMLRLNEWKNSAYFTVEHIAPQSQSDGWASGIFEDFQTVHTLGNLMLLPSDINQVLSKRSWEHKRLVYRLLSAETTAEFDTISKKLDKAGLQLSQTANDVLAKSKYLGMCKSVVLFDKPWSLDIIQKRTRRFAELAWDRLKPWLD